MIVREAFVISSFLMILSVVIAELGEVKERSGYRPIVWHCRSGTQTQIVVKRFYGKWKQLWLIDADLPNTQF